MKKLVSVVFSAALIAGCGSDNKKSDDNVREFTAVAAKGELLRYSVNESKKSYRYEIIDSAFGLNGKTGSGTYKVEADGSLTVSENAAGSQSKMYLLPNGLVLGAITEEFTYNGVKARQTTPFLGIQNPVEDLNAGAGKYNYIGQFCGHQSSICTDYGTFQIKADATWVKCDRENNADEASCNKRASGTMEHLGDGRWQLMRNGRHIGTALMFTSGDQKVSLIDLRDYSSQGLGTGIIFASSQQPVNDGDNVGTWFYNDDRGRGGIARVGKNDYAVSSDDFKRKYSFTNNSPWVGFQTSPANERSIFTGAGVFVSELNGSLLFGIKK